MRNNLCSNFSCKDRDRPHVHETSSIDSPSTLASWPLRTRWNGRMRLKPFGQFLQFGWFSSHSRFQLPWKIDCDGLDIRDWECIADIIKWKFAFGRVIGIPQGGLPLQRLLENYIEVGYSTLIVDDVLTTGRSMDEARKNIDGPVIGVVVFARGKVDDWIWPIFQVSEWAQSRGTGIG